MTTIWYTIESILPVCDKPYHMNNRFHQIWAEIKMLWNYACHFVIWKKHLHSSIVYSWIKFHWKSGFQNGILPASAAVLKLIRKPPWFSGELIRNWFGLKYQLICHVLSITCFEVFPIYISQIKWIETLGDQVSIIYTQLQVIQVIDKYAASVYKMFLSKDICNAFLAVKFSCICEKQLNCLCCVCLSTELHNVSNVFYCLKIEAP